MSECKFGVGELITMIKEHEGLKPMKQWDFFEVEDITSSGVVRLFCHADDTVRWLSVDLVNEYFDTGDKSPNIRYDDGTNTTDFPDYAKIQDNEVVGISNEEYIDDLLSEAEIDMSTFADGQLTILNVRLNNGFVLSASASYVSDMDYNEKTAYKLCINKIKNKLFEMESYFQYKAEAMMNDISQMV